MLEYNATVNQFSLSVDDIEGIEDMQCSASRVVVTVANGVNVSNIADLFHAGTIVHGGSEWNCSRELNTSTPFYYQVHGKDVSDQYITLFAASCSPFMAFETVSFSIRSERNTDIAQALRSKKRGKMQVTPFPVLTHTIDLKPWFGIEGDEIKLDFTTIVDLGPIDFEWTFDSAITYQKCTMCDQYNTERGCTCTFGDVYCYYQNQATDCQYLMGCNLCFFDCCLRSLCLYGIPTGFEIKQNVMKITMQQSLDFDLHFATMHALTASTVFDIIPLQYIPGLSIQFKIGPVVFALGAQTSLQGNTFLDLGADLSFNPGVTLRFSQTVGYNNGAAIFELPGMTSTPRFKYSANINAAFEVHIVPYFFFGLKGALSVFEQTIGLKVRD
jgi:hypothetical protein